MQLDSPAWSTLLSLRNFDHLTPRCDAHCEVRLAGYDAHQGFLKNSNISAQSKLISKILTCLFGTQMLFESLKHEMESEILTYSLLNKFSTHCVAVVSNYEYTHILILIHGRMKSRERDTWQERERAHHSRMSCISPANLIKSYSLIHGRRERGLTTLECLAFHLLI